MYDGTSMFWISSSALENKVQKWPSPAIPGLDSCTERNSAWSVWMVDGGRAVSAASIGEDGPDEV